MQTKTELTLEQTQQDVSDEVLLRDLVKPFFWVLIGNEKNTSLWYDNWCSYCPLSRLLSPRDITREGFHLKSCIVDLILNGVWSWPLSWLIKAPDMGLIAVPYLKESWTDIIQWRDLAGTLSSFSISKAWEVLRPQGSTEAMVWAYVCNLVGMECVPPDIHDILVHLHLMVQKPTARSLIGKLILAATSCYIWLERNNQIFKKTKRSPKDLRDIIMVTVRLKLLIFHFKKTTMVTHLLSCCKMPKTFRLYGE
ncbi:hypothetical protein Tco_0347294 [Tanacetum coccineum]